MEEFYNTPIRILVIEDHHDSATMIHWVLSRRGYQVKVAESAASARQFATQEQLDVVISDIMLPDALGWDLVKELKALQPVKVIALSGLAMESDRARSIAEGFDRHVNKPYRTEELLATIEELTIEIMSDSAHRTVANSGSPS